MCPNIDHANEYVHNTTAHAFSVVASVLGIPSLLPFLKAVCWSKKSWQACHTGICIVQQITIMMGCAVLPHLRNLVNCIAHGLSDEEQKVRTMTALGLAALVKAAATVSSHSTRCRSPEDLGDSDEEEEEEDYQYEEDDDGDDLGPEDGEEEHDDRLLP